jgi:excisionase family DNA binding protein
MRATERRQDTGTIPNVKATGSARPSAFRPASVVGTVQLVRLPLDPYLTLEALIGYSGLSRRTLQRHLSDARDPLPHFKPGGRILVKRSEFDQWMERHRASATGDVAGLVNAVLDKVAPLTRGRKAP